MNPIPPFVRQDDQPLYPKILYNRPVTRAGAGRLLVVGGHSGEFSLPTAIHQLSLAAGVGECRVILPDTLAKLLGGAPGTVFGPSNPSGSLGTEALGRILGLSEEADAVLVGATGNPEVLVVLTMAEVFKLCGSLHIPIHIRDGAGLINKLEIIQNLAAASRCSYAVYGSEIVIAAGGELIVTPINYRLALVPALFYSVLSTFWLQNPTDRRAGLATGAYVIRAASGHLGATDRPAVGDLAAALDRARRQDDFS
jgi:hypothetical protein